MEQGKLLFIMASLQISEKVGKNGNYNAYINTVNLVLVHKRLYISKTVQIPTLNLIYSFF